MAKLQHCLTEAEWSKKTGLGRYLSNMAIGYNGGIEEMSIQGQFPQKGYFSFKNCKTGRWGVNPVFSHEKPWCRHIFHRRFPCSTHLLIGKMLKITY